MMKKLLILFVGLHVYPPMWILTHTYIQTTSRKAKVIYLIIILHICRSLVNYIDL